MWELEHKEGWVLKNWCFWTVVLEKTLESPFDSKEIHPVHPKGNQSWIFIGRTDAEAEVPILWPPDTKNWLIGKDPHAGKDGGQEEKGRTEDEMVGWHHWLNGHEFGQTLGDGDGQGDLACCSPEVAERRTGLSDWIATTISLDTCKKPMREQSQATHTLLSRMKLGRGGWGQPPQGEAGCGWEKNP